jgi:hypothetical protein
MVKIRSRWAVLMAVAGVGIVALGAAPAAARPATSVLSDSVKFAASTTRNGSAFIFRSTSCLLTSDGEPKQFGCKLSGQFSPNSTGGDTGTATLVSGDGTTTWRYTLTCTRTPCVQVVMKGAGVEADAPEAGKPSPKYSATMSGVWNQTSSSPFSFAGSVIVREPSTAP